jgi:hypothetical protein
LGKYCIFLLLFINSHRKSYIGWVDVETIMEGLYVGMALTMKILVLEDTEDRQEFFKKLYRGHEVMLCTEPGPTIDSLRRVCYDQIWLDHDLGGAQYMESGPDSGYAVAEAMLAEDIKKLQKESFVYIHSQNPPGAVRMYDILKSNYKTLVFPMTALYGYYKDIVKGR